MAETRVVREGACQHPRVADTTILAKVERPWAGDTLWCRDCDEWLYQHDDGEVVTVLVGEPFGAGRDQAGRPDPRTHPEAWTE